MYCRIDYMAYLTFYTNQMIYRPCDLHLNGSSNPTCSSLSKRYPTMIFVYLSNHSSMYATNIQSKFANLV